jgi:hypothetical protein
MQPWGMPFGLYRGHGRGVVTTQLESEQHGRGYFLQAIPIEQSGRRYWLRSCMCLYTLVRWHQVALNRPQSAEGAGNRARAQDELSRSAGL